MQKVSNILERKGRDVWFLPPDATVYAAIEQMAQKSIGALLVLETGNLVGIVSERDYARKVILKGRASRETRIREIMSHPVICISPEREIKYAMAIMTEKRIRHLPVVEAGQVVGMISIGDVVRAIIEDNKLQIHQLMDYIHLQD